MGRYKGSPRRFQKLELWPKKFAVMSQAMQYGCDDRDLERVLVIPEFLEGEAEKWFCRHLVHVNRSKEIWIFERVITGLYDRFIHSTTMQEARDAYCTARYNPQYGVQGFYDTLMSHAQHMSVYPDSYNPMDTFLRGLPESMRAEMLKIQGRLHYSRYQ